jgi:hypothetical protein
LSRTAEALRHLVVVEERVLLMLRDGVPGAWAIAGSMQHDIDELKRRIEVLERLVAHLQLSALNE